MPLVTDALLMENVGKEYIIARKGRTYMRNIGRKKVKNGKGIMKLKGIVGCAGVELRKTDGQDMPRQRNTGKESREEVAMEKLVGIWWGQRVGRTEWQDSHY